MDVLHYANRLESILRRFLKCGYNDFGVKANDNLLDDWKSPVNFALGCLYGDNQRDDDTREKTDFFLGNEFQGVGIRDLLENYEYYSFSTKDEALKYIDMTISKIENLLSYKQN
jgi:hypothetical protein